jgi:uncharacterized lipoprotein
MKKNIFLGLALVSLAVLSACNCKKEQKEEVRQEMPMEAAKTEMPAPEAKQEATAPAETK